MARETHLESFAINKIQGIQPTVVVVKIFNGQPEKGASLVYNVVCQGRNVKSCLIQV
jgi:hypothetical protein